MKPRITNQKNHAMTLTEVLVVIAVLAVLIALILPALTLAPHRSHLNCVNNLKEIGLAYRVWAGDNGDKYPMEVSVTNGGTMELVADGKNAWLNYLVMSNILNTPKLLICPADKDHSFVTNFGTNFNNSHISYFVGSDAGEQFPQALLSGDDNFEIGGVPVKSGLLEISSSSPPVSWSAARHHFVGNIGMADGSVQQVTQSGLLLQETGVTNRLAIP